MKPPKCPYCDRSRPYVIRSAPRKGLVVYRCRQCRQDYTEQSMTNMRGCKLPQWKRDGMTKAILANPSLSIRKLAIEFEVQYKTAWLFYYRVTERPGEPIFRGTSEVRGFFQRKPGREHECFEKKREVIARFKNENG